MREAWIRAKYEKKIFEAGDEKGDDIGCSEMPEPSREGFMWKESGAAEGKFQKRWFILYGNRLSYYKDAGVHTDLHRAACCHHQLASHVYLFISPGRRGGQVL